MILAVMCLLGLMFIFWLAYIAYGPPCECEPHETCPFCSNRRMK